MIDAASLPPILTPETAAPLLRCTPKTVEERLRSGDLPGEKFGEGWILPLQAFLHRINEIAVERMLERRKTKEPSPSAVATPAPPARGRRSELPASLRPSQQPVG